MKLDTKDERHWDMIIRVRAIDYHDPINAYNDLFNMLEGFDYLNCTGLLCVEPLGHDDYGTVRLWDNPVEHSIYEEDSRKTGYRKD